jgi:hypothetical protein
MKKFLALTLTLASVGLAGGSFEAKAAGSSNSLAVVSESKAAPAAAQVYGRQRRWGRNRVRVTTQSRLVRRGRQVWRETYQVRYMPNGMTQTRLVSRVRVR